MADVNLNNAIRLLDLLGYTVRPGAGCYHVSRDGRTAGLFGRAALIDFARTVRA